MLTATAERLNKTFNPQLLSHIKEINTSDERPNVLIQYLLINFLHCTNVSFVGKLELISPVSR